MHNSKAQYMQSSPGDLFMSYVVACRNLMRGVCFNSCLMAWIIAISKAYSTGQMQHYFFEPSAARGICRV